MHLSFGNEMKRLLEDFDVMDSCHRRTTLAADGSSLSSLSSSMRMSSGRPGSRDENDGDGDGDWRCVYVLSCLFLLVLAIQFVGAYLFTNGFFLTRFELLDRSTPASCGVESGCSLSPARFSKLIILVVDALRLDFVIPNVRFGDEVDGGSREKSNYLNKLSSVRELLETRREHSLVFRFVAHPPTVTMQRLKGLTTGGLPTFIEIGRNFDSSAIAEDNIIDQMVKSGHKRIAFMGDDTWTNLFPSNTSLS